MRKQKGIKKPTGSVQARKSKVYAEFIRGLELNSIHLCGSSIDNKACGVLPASLQLEFNSRANLTGRSRDGFEVTCECLLNVKDEKKESTVTSIQAVFLLRYSTETEVTKEIFKTFKHSSLVLHIWPYFREFIYSMMMRCGLPPLTLPMVKLTK